MLPCCDHGDEYYPYIYFFYSGQFLQRVDVPNVHYAGIS